MSASAGGRVEEHREVEDALALDQLLPDQVVEFLVRHAGAVVQNHQLQLVGAEQRDEGGQLVQPADGDQDRVAKPLLAAGFQQRAHVLQQDQIGRPFDQNILLAMNRFCAME